MSRRTAAIIGIGALVLLLGIAPFVPQRHHDDAAITPSGNAGVLSASPGRGQVTDAMRAEIDRVVRAGRVAGRWRGDARADTDRLVSGQLRCAVFEEQTYCLGVGWTTQTEAQVRARAVVAARRVAARPAPAERTGDLDVLSALDLRARLSPALRARAERRELTSAARSVAKVWAIRHEIQGVPLPDGFLARHPEAVASPEEVAAREGVAGADSTAGAEPVAAGIGRRSPSARVTKPASAYPQRSKILDPDQVAEQIRSYWCGPTTTQMIVWGWTGRARSQDHWADRLGTTSSGTAITEIVRVINNNTGWDQEDHAGPYIVLDIGDWSYSKWWLLIMRHIKDYRAPVVMHPILLKKYFPYLDDDASGHYQAGRGYDKNGAKPALLGYFEPWNQQRFDPSEPYIKRVQWQRAYKSYRANQEHFGHNIGV